MTVKGDVIVAYQNNQNIPKIITNKIKCRCCGDVIESKYTHDYVKCSCGRCVVDGGKEYLRRTGYSYDIEELSEYDVELHIQRFLREHTIRGLSFDKIKQILSEKPYCVKVCEKNDLVLFKYSQHDSDFSEPILTFRI